jgi:hypothetical protein
MWTLLYSFTICVVAAVLFLIVDKFEPDRRYANVLKLFPRAWRRGDRQTVVALAFPRRTDCELIDAPKQ